MSPRKLHQEADEGAAEDGEGLFAGVIIRRVKLPSALATAMKAPSASTGSVSACDHAYEQ